MRSTRRILHLHLIVTPRNPAPNERFYALKKLLKGTFFHLILTCLPIHFSEVDRRATQSLARRR